MAKGHVHADLMAQYAKDAKTNPKPWQLWQTKDPHTGKWVDFYASHPSWWADIEYRRKPEPRYLNVYDNPVGAAPKWRKSLAIAEHYRSKVGCIGYLEDKQDGSVPVFHPLTS